MRDRYPALSRRRLLGAGAAALLPGARASAAPTDAAGGTAEPDLCVYGATPAGIAAAIQMRRMGRSVALLEPGRNLGGMTASGLGATDTGNRDAIGGIAREFYARVRERYVAKYGEDSAQVRDCRDGYRFEPSVAEAVFRAMLAEAGVPVAFGQRLRVARKVGAELREVVSDSGMTVRARVFMDATYEGDLLALAGISYTVGREGNAKYRETLNGVQFGRPFLNFRVPVDPYVTEGRPESGLLQGVSAEEGGKQGEGDGKVQAYCFRMCLTNVAANRLPFPRPGGYDPARYALLARYLQTGVWDAFRPVDPVPNGKTDVNNSGAFSTDHIGMSHEWPEGDAATKTRLHREHLVYQQGLLWFLGHDESVPPEIRDQVNDWGLPRDEFRATGGWPHQLYIREGRRLVTETVMTEHHCLGTVQAADSVGMASYAMDSHHVQRVVRDGRLQNEGDVQVAGFAPYPISYRAMTPREEECRNLLVPVCLSASHIAYGSMRMEPVFMVLGQAAATAAAHSLEQRAAVQQIDISKLQNRLREDRQVLGGLTVTGPREMVLEPGKLKGIVVDDADAAKTGVWTTTPLPNPRRVGPGYLHDDDAAKGLLSATFTPDLPADGTYDIVVVFPPNPGAATNVPVSLQVEGVGAQQFRLNERATEQNGFVSLGAFKLPAGKRTSLTISNRGTDGYVVVDAVQFIPLG